MRINQETGEVLEGELNKVIIHHTKRPDGSIRVQHDFSNCPSMAEQHTAHLSDLNYLISKYKPDELSAYLAARNNYRQEIVGHDFTKEPDLQEGKNIAYKLKKAFNDLPEEIKNQFKNHVEFLKFIDNPANAEKMVKLGLLTKKQIQQHTDPQINDDLNNEKTQKPVSKKSSQKTDPE